jgi:hypothetical protein
MVYPSSTSSRPLVEGAGPISSTSLLQHAGSSRAAPEGHERQRASGTWDLRPPAAAVEGDQGRYVGSREACLSTPPFILCAFCRRRAGLLIKANPVLPGRERRGWYPLGLVPSWAAGGGARPRRLERSTSRSRCFMSWAARIARRVLCPWRAHRLASTLPAVARATAVCFLRCECLRGRDVGRPRDPSRRLGARCWLVYEYTRPTAGGQSPPSRSTRSCRAA